MSVSRFVGRTVQINQIEQHICLSGQPRVLLVQGLAGIGKTRFLQEVKGMALHQDMEVYTGRCDETLTQPYAPFIALLPRFEDGGYWINATSPCCAGSLAPRYPHARHPH